MLMVILCHLHLMAIGWIGLSSFFVLSGFLITRILLKEWEHAPSFGSYLRRFYARRFLRIFPIYYAYLLVLFVGTLLVPKLAGLSEQLPYAFLYVYNIYGAIEYPQHSRMLVHLWSLSVEEQFYLIWPLAMAMVPPRGLRALVVGMIVCAPLLRAAVVYWWPLDGFLDLKAPSVQSVYALTPSYLDGFAFGALINFIQYRPKGWHILLLSALAIIMGAAVNGLGGIPGDQHARTLVLGWPLYMAHGYQYVWGYTLVNIFWFMIISSIVHGGVIKRFFSIRGLDFLGKRSYSTYILHYPLLALSYPVWHSLTDAFGRLWGTLVFLPPFLIATISCASLSYRFIEMPSLNLKERFALTADRRSPRKPVIPPAVAGDGAR